MSVLGYTVAIDPRSHSRKSKYVCVGFAAVKGLNGIFLLLSSLSGAQFLMDRYMASSPKPRGHPLAGSFASSQWPPTESIAGPTTGDLAPWSFPGEGNLQADRPSSQTSFRSCSSAASNPGSVAAFQETRFVWEKMDKLLREMPSKLVPLDGTLGELRDDYSSFQAKVTECAIKWQKPVTKGTVNTRGLAAIRFYNNIYQAAMKYEVKRLQVGVKSVDNGERVGNYSTVIDVCKCTRARIHQLYMNAQSNKNLKRHDCLCPQGVQGHGSLDATNISYAKAAEGLIQWVEAYRQLHRKLLGEDTWL